MTAGFKSDCVVLVLLETLVFGVDFVSLSVLVLEASALEVELLEDLVEEDEDESPIFVRSVALVLLLTVNSVDLAAASRAEDKSAVALLLGSVIDTVGVSPSSNFPKSGVDVQDEPKARPVPNLDEVAVERESEEEAEVELLELTPESVEEDDEVLPSSRPREEVELQEDKLGVDMVTSSLRKEVSLSFVFPPCSL